MAYADVILELKRVIMEICCLDVRNRDDASRISRYFNSVENVCNNINLHRKLIAIYNNVKEVGDEILAIFQNIQRYRLHEKFILYESLLHVTNDQYRKIISFSYDYNVLGSMLLKNAVIGGDWGEEVTRLLNQCPLIPDEYKLYCDAIHKLGDLNSKAIMFYNVLKEIVDCYRLPDHKEVLRSMILNIGTFNVKNVEERREVMEYLTNHGKEIDLTINNHIEIMSTIKLIGWHGMNTYYEALTELVRPIVDSKTSILLDRIIFRSCCRELRVQHALTPDERRMIVTYFEFFGKFLLPKEYISLMKLYHETEGKEVTSSAYRFLFERIHVLIKKLEKFPHGYNNEHFRNPNE